MTVDLDDIDLAICEALAWEGRLSYRELGDRIGLSSPATADRVRRLEQRGVIVGYQAVIDYEVLGFPILSIIRLNNSYRSEGDIDETLADVPEVIEANRVTGAESHVIRARVRTTSHLEDLLKLFWNQTDTITNIVTSSPIPRRPMLLRRALGRG